MLRGDNDYPGWRWADVLPHFRAMEGNNRLYDERPGNAGNTTAPALMLGGRCAEFILEQRTTAGAAAHVPPKVAAAAF
jgi:choline dehydrogenase-like flavoprotein